MNPGASNQKTTPRGIRTPNRLIRSQALYPVELWAQVYILLRWEYKWNFTEMKEKFCGSAMGVKLTIY